MKRVWYTTLEHKKKNNLGEHLNINLRELFKTHNITGQGFTEDGLNIQSIYKKLKTSVEDGHLKKIPWLSCFQLEAVQVQVYIKLNFIFNKR